MCIENNYKEKKKRGMCFHSFSNIYFHYFTFHQTKETKVKENNKLEQPIFLSLVSFQFTFTNCFFLYPFLIQPLP